MEALVQQFGLPIALVVTYSGVIVFLYLRLQKANDKYDALQEKRLAEAIAARDKIAEPMEKLTTLSENIYGYLLDSNKRGK